jgi:endoglucanase
MRRLTDRLRMNHAGVLGLGTFAVTAVLATGATTVMGEGAVRQMRAASQAVSVARAPASVAGDVSGAAGAAYDSGYRRGVAVAGGSFGDGVLGSGRTAMTNATPGEYGRDWFYDVDGEHRTDDRGLAYLAGRGHRLIRVDFRWERLQPSLRGRLDPAEVGRITAMLDAAARNGMQVILDCHNYGHYKAAGSPDVSSAQGGWPIGDDNLPAAAFADFWRRAVTKWGDHPAVWGWELMNEPVAMGDDGGTRWRRASQAAVSAIRGAERPERARAILVGGYNWSRVQDWDRTNGAPWINDPLGDPDRLIYTAHHYWDAGGDSSYGADDPRHLSAGPSGHAERIVAELREFTSWLRRHDVRGAITEVGWPDNAAASAWNAVAEQWFREADAARLHVTAWATGAAWGDYELAVYEARPGSRSWHGGDVIDTPNVQAEVLERHPSNHYADLPTRAH